MQGAYFMALPVGRAGHGAGICRYVLVLLQSGGDECLDRDGVVARALFFFYRHCALRCEDHGDSGVTSSGERSLDDGRDPSFGLESFDGYALVC